MKISKAELEAAIAAAGPKAKVEIKFGKTTVPVHQAMDIEVVVTGEPKPKRKSNPKVEAQPEAAAKPKSG